MLAVKIILTLTALLFWWVYIETCKETDDALAKMFLAIFPLMLTALAAFAFFV